MPAAWAVLLDRKLLNGRGNRCVTSDKSCVTKRATRREIKRLLMLGEGMKPRKYPCAPAAAEPDADRCQWRGHRFALC